MNYFSENPLKITVVTRLIDNSLCNKTYIIIGHVPLKIQKEIEKKPKHSQLLKKIYGATWRSKLGLNLYIGGDTEVEEPITEVEEPITEVDIEFDTTDLTSKKTLKEDIFVKSKKISKPLTSKEKVIYIFNMDIFSEDKISELKRKLYIITGIPIYRQHLWYKIGNTSTPLSYVIYLYDNKLYVDISDIFNITSDTILLESIPVEMNMYENKSNIKVIAYDEFRILKDFHDVHGNIEYKLIDADNYIGPIKTTLEKMISPDKSKFELTFEIIYYSFIIKYFPMMTINVFIEYIINEKDMKDYFPELAMSLDQLKELYTKQNILIRDKNNIISYLYPHKKDKLKPYKPKISSVEANKIKKRITFVKNNLRSSIMIITINVIHNILNRELLYLRNLFDQYDVDKYVNFIQVFLFHEGKRVLFKKIYKNCAEPIEKIKEGTMLFRIFINTETTDHIDLTLLSNGNYKIQTTWREELNYGFKEVYELVEQLVNPIINKINSFGAKVLRYEKIPNMNWYNITFTDISVSIFHKCDIQEKDFELFKTLIKNFDDACISEPRKIDNYSIDYYFKKGMYKFDPMRIEKSVGLMNYYAYLSDSIIKTKWDSIFVKCRILRINKRFSGIKLEINGIKKLEYDIFLDYILYLLYQFTLQKKTYSVDSRKLKTIKRLVSLKEQDPVLYDFKKKYGSNVIYSKICQKPFQPLLLTQRDYERLNTIEKNKVLKWKNQTTLEDAYYYCPNPKYPYVRFKIGRHPKGYGIPCCQKTNVPINPKDISHIIHNIIMKEYVYLEEKKLKISSRYIMTYGKDIEAGRLSKLPEETLEVLFYESDIITDTGIEGECVSNTGYYLMGVTQNISSISNVGFLSCLASSMEITLEQLILNTINSINKNPSLFQILLNGKITHYFTNFKELIVELKYLFINTSIIERPWDSFTLWNSLFIDIAKYYFAINVILFEDKNDIENISLVLSPYISDSSDFLTENHQNIIVIKKCKEQITISKISRTRQDQIFYYYPIYIINKDIYFKTKVVDRRLFSNNHYIINNIVQMVASDINIGSNITSPVPKTCIDLIILQGFVKFTQDKQKKKPIRKYIIELLYINKQNLCYTVKLSSSRKYIHISIKPSYYKLEGYELSFKPYIRSKSPTQLNTLLQFIKDYNYWIAIKSEEAGLIKQEVSLSSPITERVVPIYPYLAIDNWIELKNPLKLENNGYIIGFCSNDLTYYFSPIKKTKALRMRNIKCIPFLYHPDNINEVIFKCKPPVIDKRCVNIDKALYKHHLYQLLVLEYMDLFNEERNINIRRSIINIIKKQSKNWGKTIIQINNIISNYYKHIKFSKENSIDDKRKINQQIRLSIFQKNDKNQLIDTIKSSIYNFDRITICKLRGLNITSVIQELHKISKKITVIESVDNIKNFIFPNNYVSCINYFKLRNKNKSNTENNVGYCKSRKLRITKNKLNEYIQLLATDIIDPLKSKYIMSLVFAEKNLDYYKFIKRNTETIRIIIM